MKAHLRKTQGEKKITETQSEVYQIQELSERERHCKAIALTILKQKKSKLEIFGRILETIKSDIVDLSKNQGALQNLQM